MALVNSRFSRTITLLITMLSLSLPAYAQYSGGTGEPNDPYQIATAEDLMLLGETPEDYDKHFILIADIDLDPNLPGRKIFDKAIIAPDVNDANGLFEGIPFTGFFDGKDHMVSNLHIKGGMYLGLFGQLGTEGEILNLGLEAIDVNGTGGNIGSLVGSNNGDITKCYSTGSVSGEWAGGLVCGNIGNINMSYSTCKVTGNGLTGGLFSIGGLVSINVGSVIMSYSNSTVNSTNSIVGGLVGVNLGDVTYCYSTGEVRGNGNNGVGGLVGENWSMTGNVNVTNCYSTATVTGNDYVGGLVGRNDGTITTSYSAGAVSGNGESVGGLVGSVGWYGNVLHSFWDTETSGQSKSDEGIGLPTNQMQTAVTFINWGISENEVIWTIDEGKDYPRLWWQHMQGKPIEVGTTLSDFLVGEGTENSPYLIYTSGELFMIGLFPNDWDKHFKMMVDIDLSGYLFNRAVIAPDTHSTNHFRYAVTPFEGVFDGNDQTISNLTIDGGGYLGLFGRLESGAYIKNLGVVDVNITGFSSHIGGLVGYNNDGNVTSCFSTGTISGNRSVGGLAGTNSGSITNCYSTCTVNGDETVGGLSGSNSSNITTSYSTGFVSGDEPVGGLVGYNEGVITTSYSTGETIGDFYVGGLVGMNGFSNVIEAGIYLPGTIINCYSTGKVSDKGDIGGIGRYRGTGRYS